MKSQTRTETGDSSASVDARANGRIAPLASGALLALVLAVIVSLLPGPAAVPAHAAEGTIGTCWLDASGDLVCEGDNPASCDVETMGYLACQPLYPPPELLNPGVLAQASDDNERTTLLVTQHQAVQNVLASHQLPDSDRAAVLSWARPEVEAEFVALVLNAAETPPVQRSADQAILVRWLGRLVKERAVAAAEKAGEEFVRWAGFSRSKYWQKVHESQDALADFLSGTPEPKAAEPLDALDPRPSGYCDYKAPAPYSGEYDGSYLQTCFTPCSNLAGCPIPTPTYDQFVRWGQVDQHRLLNDPDFQLTTAQIAGIAAAAGGVGASLGFAASGAIFGAEAMATALFPMRGVDLFNAATEAVYGVSRLTQASEFFASMAGTVSIASAAVGMVAVITTALYVGIYQFLNLLSSERLPLALASYVKQAQNAQNAIYDPGTLIKTTEGATSLLVALTAQLLPAAKSNTGIRKITAAGQMTQPIGDARCDNSLLTAEDYLHRYGNPKIVDNPENPAEYLVLPIAPCLNVTRIPPATENDPHFVVRPRNPAPGEAQQYLSRSVDLVNDSAGYSSEVRISGRWFVETVKVDDLEGRWQTLRLKYTDWNGKLQSAYLYDDAEDGYRFVGTEVGADVDPDTCVAAGTCWSRSSIEYVGPDGKHYQALVDTESIGQPTITTATPLSGAPVSFHANAFAPGNPTGEITYEWRFQKDGCGAPCVSFANVAPGSPPAPVYGDPVSGISPSYTWRTAGHYQVEVTATDAAGRFAVTTFTAGIGGLPPQLLLPPPCTVGQVTNCYSTSSSVGTTAAVTANISHPGTMDNLSVSVDWGDGASTNLQHGPNVQDKNTATATLKDINPSTMQLWATHLYTKPGTFTVTLNARDQAGNASVKQFLVPVSGRQTITFDPMPSRSYGAKVIARATGGGSTEPVTYTAGPSTVCTSSGNNGELITMVGVGQCTVTANQAGSGIFLAALPVSRSFSVNPAPMTIRAEDKTKTYGDPNPQFTARFLGMQNGDTPDDFGVVLFRAPEADASVGKYPIVPSEAKNSNYEIRFESGVLDVQQAPLTITPDDKTRVYGSDRPSYTATFEGLVNGDTRSDITGLQLDGAPKAAPAGQYRIQASSAQNPNYKITYHDGTETITKAPLTITANDLSHPYGSPADFAATYSGLVNGDTQGVIDGLEFEGAPAAADVGEYPISLSGATNPNYDITLVNGTEKITPAPLTITAADKSRLYGAASPTYTANFSGLKNLDTKGDITGLTMTGAPAKAGVGTYPIVPSGASNPNYDISYVDGTETVTKAPLTVTAEDKSKVYGAPDPVFTAKYDGLVNGDTESAITGLEFASAPTGSDAGTYPIVPKGATSPNYDIGFANGTETITPAPLTIRAQDKTTKYGTVATYTWNGDGWVNGDSDATIDTAPTCRATIQGAAASVTTAPGAYLGAITCSGAADPNYTVGYASGNLTVNPVIRLDQTGLPSTVARRATIDGKVVTLPTSELEVGYGTAHGYSFPAVVTDANGVAYMTRTTAFTGPVVGNLVVTASYSTMSGVLAGAVAGGGLDQRTASSLTKIWNDVQAGIKSGNLAKARGSVKQFADAVRAQRGKKIKTATADTLLAYAQLVHTHVGGGTL